LYYIQIPALGCRAARHKPVCIGKKELSLNTKLSDSCPFQEHVSFLLKQQLVLATGWNETLGWTNPRPGLVTLISMALMSAQRRYDLEEGISLFKCKPYVGNEKSTAENHAACHCVFRIIVWLSSTHSNGCQACFFFPFWIVSNIYFRDINALSTAYKMLQHLLEQGFVDVADGSTLLCLTCLRARLQIQFTAQLHTVAR